MGWYLVFLLRALLYILLSLLCFCFVSAILLHLDILQFRTYLCCFLPKLLLIFCMLDTSFLYTSLVPSLASPVCLVFLYCRLLWHLSLTVNLPIYHFLHSFVLCLLYTIFLLESFSF